MHLLVARYGRYGKVNHCSYCRGRLCEREPTWSKLFLLSRPGDLGNAGRFFTTIAAQLAGNVPSLRFYISKAISEKPQIIREGLGEQWKYLIFQPLLRLEKRSLRPQVFILVVDALDECKGEDDIRLILRLLAETKWLQKVKLRVFITSRPETPIQFGFREMPDDAHQDFALHNIDQTITRHDIYLFLSYELEGIQKEYRLQQGWPGNRNIQLLAEKACGLFIYAATACRFIRTSKYPIAPEGRLELILQAQVTSQSPNGVLDKIYFQALEHSLMGDSGDFEREGLGTQFKAVVGPIVVLFDTLACTSLAKLINTPDRDMLAILSNLHSILDIPENQSHPIQLLHPSFRDFLLNSDRCPDSHFWINERNAHETLVKNCLRIMSDYLRRDICSLKVPGAPSCGGSGDSVQHCLPAELQYACRYWVEHLLKSNLELHDDDQIHIFLRQHLLHWLETLSLMGKTSDGVLAINSLESTVVVS